MSSEKGNGQAKHNSIALTEGPNRAPARAMLRAVGFSDVLVKQHDTPRRPYLVGVAQ